MISCRLVPSEDWTAQKVTLTLEKVGDVANKITCMTINRRPFTCAGTASDIGLKEYSPETDFRSDKVSMTATLNDDTITSTIVYRCSVEVAGEDDEKATDTKLIYVQKIRKFRIYREPQYFDVSD